MSSTSTLDIEDSTKSENIPNPNVGFVPLQYPKLSTFRDEEDVEVESIIQQHVHKVAEDGDVKELKSLLTNGINPNIKDGTGRTPLHCAVSIGCRCTSCLLNSEACIKLLLRTQLVDINAQDDKGNTPLHLAIENQLTRCAEILISAGADVCLKSSSGEEPVYLLLKNLPDTMSYLLDECLFVDKHDPKDEKCVLKVDFSPLVGNPKFRTIDGKPCSSGSSSSCAPRSDLRISWQREMRLLLFILQNPGTRPWRQKILTHPVVQIFMEQEWKRVRKFFLFSAITYMIYVLVYTYYILNVYLFKCPNNHFLLNESLVDSDDLISNRSRRDWVSINSFAKLNTSNLTLEEPDYDYVEYSTFGMVDLRFFRPNATSCEDATGVGTEVCIILVLTTILAMVELGKLIIVPKMYIRSYLSWGFWAFIGLVYLSTIPNLSKQQSIGILQYQTAALSVFLGWAFILQPISRFPALGKYIEMFGVVLQSFGFFLLTFLSLFMAFALSFAIVFPTRPAFSKLLPSILKVLVMMTGEMDYNTLFYANTDNIKGLLLGHVLFAAFVFIVAIVLMNVVIAITVQDVQKLQAEGELRRVSRLILELHSMESFIFSKRVPRFLGDKLKATISVLQPNKQGRREGLIFEFRPNSRKDRSVSKHVKEQALKLASVTYERFKEDECSKFSGVDSVNGSEKTSYHPVILRRLNRQHYKLIAAKSSIYRGRRRK